MDNAQNEMNQTINNEVFENFLSDDRNEYPNFFAEMFDTFRRNKYSVEPVLTKEEKDSYFSYLDASGGNLINYSELGLSEDGNLSLFLETNEAFRYLSDYDKAIQWVNSQIVIPKAAKELKIDRDGDGIADGRLETETYMEFLDLILNLNGENDKYNSLNKFIPSYLYSEQLNLVIENGSQTKEEREVQNIASYYSYDSDFRRLLDNVKLGNYEEGPTLEQLEQIYAEHDTPGTYDSKGNYIPDPSSPVRYLDFYTEWRFEQEFHKLMDKYGISDHDEFVENVNLFYHAIATGYIENYIKPDVDSNFNYLSDMYHHILKIVNKPVNEYQVNRHGIILNNIREYLNENPNDGSTLATYYRYLLYGDQSGVNWNEFIDCARQIEGDKIEKIQQAYIQRVVTRSGNVSDFNPNELEALVRICALRGDISDALLTAIQLNIDPLPGNFAQLLLNSILYGDVYEDFPDLFNSDGTVSKDKFIGGLIDLATPVNDETLDKSKELFPNETVENEAPSDEGNSSEDLPEEPEPEPEPDNETIVDNETLPSDETETKIGLPFDPEESARIRAKYIGIAQQALFHRSEDGFATSHVVVDPLVVDLDGNGFETTGQAGGVYFDLDNNGFAERTSWISGGNDGFITLDLNENGIIDSGAELFGNYTKLSSGKLAKNGFEALSQYDENADGKIDENDEVYDKLQVWVDNGNGTTENSELHSLSELGIASIGVPCFFLCI